MTFTALVVDDHTCIHEGAQSLLSPDCAVTCVAYNITGAREVARRMQPDVILCDFRLTGFTGDPPREGRTTALDFLSTYPGIPTIVWSGYDNPTDIIRAYVAGAADYILKGDDRDSVLDAIASAVAQADEQGTRAIARAISRPAASRMANCVKQMLRKDTVEDGVFSNVTCRETQVARHIGFGLSNAEIRSSLGISIDTVKEHVQSILRKCNFADRTECAVNVHRSGLIDLDFAFAGATANREVAK